MADASIMKEDDEDSMMLNFMNACKTGNVTAVEDLLRAFTDLDINQTNEAGETPFLLAVEGGHLDVLKLLHSRGVKVNRQKEMNGDTALHLAARNGHLPCVEFLIEQAEADINCENESKNTPLHDAAFAGQEQVVEFLCHSHANLNPENLNGYTPLHLACAKRNTPAALALLHAGCRMDITNKTLDTPLHIACQRELLSVVQAMCAFGCAVDVVDALGMTPLHLAAQTGNADMVRYLLLSNADCKRVNKDEARPEDLARGHGHNEVGDLLASMRSNPSMGSAQQLMPTNKPIGRAKVKIFGNSGVGKTTLIESLKVGYVRSFFRWHPPLKDLPTSEVKEETKRRLFNEIPIHSEYTRGINIQQINIWGPGDISFWEFSGFEPYHTTYDHFVGERHCIHIVVVSMLDSPEVRTKQLFFWLNFIRSHMSPTEPIGFGGGQLWPARVLIIAAHADEAHCAKNQRGEWEMEGKPALVNTILKTFGSDLLIVPHLYVMDAHESAGVEMKHLRLTLSEMKNFIVQYLPPLLGMYDASVSALTAWAKTLYKFPCVTWTNFVQHIRTKVNLLATDEHIAELIRQLQLSGEIIYLQTNTDNDDMIVINPRWLCSDILGTLLSHEHVVDVPQNGRLTLEYIDVLFPESDVASIAALLEVVQVSVGCQMNNKVLLDCPCLNVLGPPEDVSKADAVHGGIMLVLTEGMDDQLLHLFPRIQTGMHRLLRQRLTAGVVLYQWGWGTKVETGGDLEATVSLLRGVRHRLEIRCSGPADDRSALFAFQDDLCDIVFLILSECVPGMYTQWVPISPRHLRENRKDPHVYASRAILLAQKENESTVGLDADAREQLSDVVAFGSSEIYARMQKGFDQHVSSLSLYARYQLAALLDPTHPLGYDWCMLALSLGLSEALPRFDVKEAAPLSKTDGILALWSSQTDATIRALHDKIVALDRNDVVDALLSLAPLFRYVPPQDAASSSSATAARSSAHAEQMPAQYALPKEGTRQALPQHDEDDEGSETRAQDGTKAIATRPQDGVQDAIATQQRDGAADAMATQPEHGVGAIATQPQPIAGAIATQPQHDAVATQEQRGGDAIATQPEHGISAIATQPQHGADAIAAQPEHGSDSIATQPQHGADAMTTQPQHGAVAIATQPEHGVDALLRPPSQDGNAAAEIAPIHRPPTSPKSDFLQEDDGATGATDDDDEEEEEEEEEEEDEDQNPTTVSPHEIETSITEDDTQEEENSLVQSSVDDKRKSDIKDDEVDDNIKDERID